MAAELIDNIRYGQAQLRDRMLSDIALDRGILTVSRVPERLAGTTVGTLGEQLVNSGVISSQQLAQLSDELDMMDLVDTVHNESAPIEVRAAAEDQGRRVGRYVLVDQLGAGGMGVVWRAWDSQLSRWVAVKVLKVQEPKLIRRFMREATLLAKLAHPNITRVYEAGVHEGRPFLVMEMVDGGAIDTKPMSRKYAAEVTRDAARAVHYAHEQGLVHRDLKPSNLLISSAGRVFVTDFGLARMREEGGSLTVSGALLGTPSFMAPEQAQGRAADQRTDVYGLGATLFALVEGRPPYSGELVHEVVKRVAMSTAPGLSGSDDLVVVAQKAMERDREDRYQSARELAEELDRYINDVPITARKISSVERVWRRAKRRPAVAASVTLATLVVTSALAWSGNFAVDYVQRRAQVSKASAPLSQAVSVAELLRKLYVSERFEASWEQAALADLNKYADAALAAAPGYAPALTNKGLAQMWARDYKAAIETFSAALVDDPDAHSARGWRVLSRYAIADASSPQLIQDYDGFRIEAPPPGPAVDAELAPIEADLEKLPPGFAQRTLGEALLASSRGRFAESRDGIEKYVEEQPYDMTARGLLMWPLLAVGDFAAAVSYADSLIERGWFPANSLSTKALALTGLGEIDAAIAAFRQSLALKNDNATRAWMAFSLVKQGKYDEALAEYSTVLEDDPDNVQALTGRSNTYLIMSQGAADLAMMDAALEDATLAAQLQPGYDYAHFLVGQALAGSDPDAALEAFVRAIEISPDYSAAYATMATTLFTLGDVETAIDAMTKALGIEPENRSWRNLLARMHLQLDDFDAALGVLDTAADDDVDAIQLRATIRFMTGDPDGALALATDATERDPDNAGPWLDRGKYEAVLGQVDAASASFARAGALAPDTVGVLHGMANGWFQADRSDLAYPAAARLVEKLPDSVGYLLLLAHIEVALDRPADALAAYTRAAELDPADPWPRIWQGEILYNEGRNTEARDVLVHVLADHPEQAYATGVLAQVLWALGDRSDAQEQFTRAIGFDPDAAHLWLMRGQLRLELDDCAGAHSDFAAASAKGFAVPAQMTSTLKLRCPPATGN